MKTRFALAVLGAVLGVSCAVSNTTPEPAAYSNFLNPSAKYVRERQIVSNPAAASIRELALSVPTYEGSGQEGKTSPKGDAWTLLGDGAQCPVIAKRLTAPGENPVRLRLLQGASPPQDPDLATLYELEKVQSGWKIVSARKGRFSELRN